MTIKPEDYLLLMFSMKGVGKRVNIKHIREKLSRDVEKVSEEEAKKIVEKLIKQEFLEEVNGKYGITERGKECFSKRIEEVEKELKKINEPWVIVYKAKQYYPTVADTILEFCKDRYVGFYCLFTEQRFFRRDFKGKKITLKTPKDLLFFINIHYIDVIPCVHRVGINRPDWLVIDVDAGPKVSWRQTKDVTEATYKICEKLSLNPALKFSGSRGFQIWSSIKKFPLPKGYQPLTLRGNRERERNYFSLFADFVRLIQKEVDEEIPNITTSDVGLKKSRVDKVLLDPSSMKPMGLTRSPYGVHSKTGLTSLPLSVKDLGKFEPEDATTEKTIERYNKKGNEFILKASNPSKLIELF